MALLRRPTTLATVAGAAVLLAFPLSAAARERDVPRPGPLPAGLELGHVHDTVLRGEAPQMRVARAAARRRAYRTRDGHEVLVEASPSYPYDPTADQALVDFLGSLVHGPELSALGVYVGTPAEIVRLCGGDPRVVACYDIVAGRMFVPGEQVQGIPVEYALTHEYGHHVASWRSNNPWSSLDWGAKYWASETRVCTHVAKRRLFPGNQGAHYFDDPGEGFADGYAHLHYPEVPWQYNDLMRPDRSAFAAIRRDVLRPWTENRTRTFRGRLGPGRSTRRFRFRVTLDGNVSLHLAAERHASVSVTVEARGYAAGRDLRAGRGFGIEWCRRRPVEHVTLTVRRRSGAGPFALTASWPG